MIGIPEEVPLDFLPEINDLQEFNYRKAFKLSAEQMANEPMDKMNINLHIMEMVAIRDKEKSAMMEAEAKAQQHHA